jgi:hypothetical protein
VPTSCLRSGDFSLSISMSFSVSLNTNVFNLFVALSFATRFGSHFSIVRHNLHKMMNYSLFVLYYRIEGPGSSVGIATELRAGRSGVESRWGRDFPPVQTGPGAHTVSCTMGTGSFPGVEVAEAWD